MLESTSRRRWPNGLWCVRQKQRQGQRQREAWTGIITRTQLNVRIVEKRGHRSKDCWSKKDQTNKGAHNLDSIKPVNKDPEVEIGGFDMGYFNVDAVSAKV